MILRMATPIGPEPQQPNPALGPLARLVGQWRTTGTHPLIPGTTFHGRTSFEWHEGGAFILMRSEIDEPEIPNAVAVRLRRRRRHFHDDLLRRARDLPPIHGRGGRRRSALAPRRSPVRPAHGRHHCTTTSPQPTRPTRPTASANSGSRPTRPWRPRSPRPRWEGRSTTPRSVLDIERTYAVPVSEATIIG
jgi:hypothetical protein